MSECGIARTQRQRLDIGVPIADQAPEVLHDDIQILRLEWELEARRRGRLCRRIGSVGGRLTRGSIEAQQEDMGAEHAEHRILELAVQHRHELVGHDPTLIREGDPGDFCELHVVSPWIESVATHEHGDRIRQQRERHIGVLRPGRWRGRRARFVLEHEHLRLPVGRGDDRTLDNGPIRTLLTQEVGARVQ